MSKANEKMEEMRLQGELLRIKNERYAELDKIIWDKRKEYNDWEERFEALREVFNIILTEMANLIDEHLEKVVKK